MDHEARARHDIEHAVDNGLRDEGPAERLRPEFLEVPLDLRDPFLATLLGSIVSLTPGTVSIDIDRERWVLLVHALHVDDAAAAIAAIKTRYEAPIRRVFGC